MEKNVNANFHFSSVVIFPVLNNVLIIFEWRLHDISCGCVSVAVILLHFLNISEWFELGVRDLCMMSE